MRQRKKKIRPVKRTIAFVVDGKTEVWYLEMLKKVEEKRLNTRINIMPKLPNKRSLDMQLKEVRELAEENLHVFWIIDLDQVIKEQGDWNNGKGISPMGSLINNRKEAENIENVSVIINNPCLEFWFLLHYKKTSKRYTMCDDAGRDLKKYMKDYSKSEKFYKRRHSNIYTILQPKIKDAINNGKSLGGFDQSMPNNALAEMYEIFESDVLGLGY